MSISDSISRLTSYYARHGLETTIRRARLALKRALFANRMVVFYCDLSTQTLPAVDIPASFKIECLWSEGELNQQHLETVISLWNPRLARRNMNERFSKGASLWFIESGKQLAGYGWTLQGYTIEPYYFPLGRDDAHLFDFHVLPEYRGRGINPLLVGYIVRTLASDCGGRAFIEAAEWNEAQLCSLRKTPFRRLGLARSFSLFGHKFTSWAEDEAKQVPQAKESRDKAPATARSLER
jgi:ribosomal protein S18 acetylase RimI-like enzyme